MPESRKKAKRHSGITNYSEGSFYRKIPCKHFTLEGFSRSPVMTFWRVPNTSSAISVGNWEFMLSRWFVSHAPWICIASSLRGATTMMMEPPTIYLPERRSRRASSSRRIRDLNKRAPLHSSAYNLATSLSFLGTRRHRHKTWHRYPRWIMSGNAVKASRNIWSSPAKNSNLNLAGVEISYEQRFRISSATVRARLDENRYVPRRRPMR